MANSDSLRRSLRLVVSDYGMLLVLFAIGAYLSVVTYTEQHPTGLAAARQLAASVRQKCGDNARVLVVARQGAEDEAFAEELKSQLETSGLRVAGVVTGEPAEARKALTAAASEKLDAVACHPATAGWTLFENMARISPALAETQVLKPESYYWPNFLKAENLLNIANQIAVIAIVAIGMTMVVISGGIDLSVGSLIALSAVVVARLIRDYGGGASAGTPALLAASAAAIMLCALCGVFSATMITRFRVPPFIVTLGVMLMAGGEARAISEGETINQVPQSFMWLGRGADLFGIPNAVVLMLVLYSVAHIVMTRTSLGRYIYAVGGNAEAARLSGVPVRRVLLVVYAVCGALAGLGGVILASLFQGGSPVYGKMYELYVIAAVVVGGASLSGGEGRIFSTLIGAFIIAVIQNGMNLTGIRSESQEVVLGAVILGAVILDKLKSRGTS